MEYLIERIWFIIFCFIFIYYWYVMERNILKHEIEREINKKCLKNYLTGKNQ